MLETIEWIDSNAKQPNEGITVLIKMPSTGEPVWIGFLEDGEWFTVEGMACAYQVTHWAEMPTGPGSGKEGV